MWSVPTRPLCFRQTRWYKISKVRPYQMGDCSIWLFFTSPPLPRLSLIRLTGGHYWKYPRNTSKDGWRRRGGRGGEEEEPSMHDQTSVAHWSASLAFADWLLWPKRKSGGWSLIKNWLHLQDIGRTNDCRFCILSSQGVKKGAICAVSVGGTALSGIKHLMYILNVNNRLDEEKTCQI